MKKKDEWKLDKIEIEFKRYGEDKGKYSGMIRFQNGEYESFTFRVRPDMAGSYIQLIADDVVKAADNLGNRLIESLGLSRDDAEIEK